jgi:hypothetical protein
VRVLRAEFDGRYRIRWSILDRCWQIEQKVARGIQPTRPYAEVDDHYIRFKDGYALAMRVQPNPRMACPAVISKRPLRRCGCPINVPILRTGDAICPACGKHTPAAYFPLGDALLQQLRYGDPSHGGYDRTLPLIRDMEQRREAAMTKAHSNANEDIAKDTFNQWVGIPSWGYTKPAFTGSVQTNSP